MPILKKEEFFEKLNARLNGDTSDEAIAFLEDMTDTYTELEKRANGDGEDWERRYHELDESWKKRYAHRFFSGDGGNGAERIEETEEEKTPETIMPEDLFEEKKEE